ncbi:MAG: asparagine synthase (glutamine-hydrolyzing) [Oscillospiraceae bacterium]|jgi:asparagine synthase (glutamine-hydrolysing)|nr:asparagine synthase (glutamine-hydrolyzing) [Oscillospiraceae bacterium]
MHAIAGMAGFAGPIHSFYGVAGLMLEKLARRGAAMGSMVFSKDACLLQGHPAASSETVINGRRLIISCSAELYNAKELRKRLADGGGRVNWKSDAALILALYAEYGADFLNELNGVFSFAIWDEERETLFCARDRFGVKPFFYMNERGVFAFSTELKALLAHPFVNPAIDGESVAELMLIGPGRSPGCGVLRGVHELRAGHCALFDKTGLSVSPYYTLRAAEHTENFEETAEHVKALLTDAIERRLDESGQICSMLSGGLDSSIVTAVAKKRLPEGALKTYSVDYKDNARYFRSTQFQPGSDAQYVEIMGNFLGLEHKSVELETDALVESLFRAVDARDMPGMADVDGSLLLFCEEMAKDASVALSGECADEVFGGYPWFRDESVSASAGFPWSQSTLYRAGFLREGALGGIDPEDYVAGKYNQTVADTCILPGDGERARRTREMTRLNADWFMRTLLERAERMGAYSGMTVRVPFCDHRLVEYLYNVPPEFRDYQGREKGLLRRAFQGVLPDEVLWRKKSPYPKTHNPDFMARVSGLLSEIIRFSGSPILEIIKKEALEKLLSDNRAIPWYGQLMTTPQTIAYFVQLNYWLQKFKVRITV